jgi:hypothetical protein
MLTKFPVAPVRDYLPPKDIPEVFATIESQINTPPNTVKVSKNTTKKSL